MVKPSLWKLLGIKHVNKKLKPEAKIQFDFVNCLRTLSLDGKLNCVWLAVSNETGRSDHPTFGQLQKMLGKIAGSPDMLFLWRDGCGCIEFKQPGGKQNPNQKYFQEWCEDLGIDYRVCYSKGEGLAVLLEWGVIDENENQRIWFKYNQTV